MSLGAILIIILIIFLLGGFSGRFGGCRGACAERTLRPEDHLSCGRVTQAIVFVMVQKPGI